MNDDRLPLSERLSDEADQCRNDGAADVAALLDEGADAVAWLRLIPTRAEIQAVAPVDESDTVGLALADSLMPQCVTALMQTPDRVAFWRDLLNGLLAYAEADVGKDRMLPVAWGLALSSSEEVRAEAQGAADQAETLEAHFTRVRDAAKAFAEASDTLNRAKARGADSTDLVAAAVGQLNSLRFAVYESAVAQLQG